MVGQRKVNLDKVKPGMRIARKVENTYGATLLPPGMILDNNTIYKLQNLQLEYVHIFDETAEIQEIQIENIKNFTTGYQHNIDEIKDIFNALSLSGKFEYSHYNRIKEIVNSILKMNTNFDIINMLGQARSVDDYTYTHSINVGILAMLLGKWVKLNENRIKNLVFSGLLHDIGKARIAQKLLNKKGKLSEQEYEEMKKHTIYGYELISKCKLIPKEVSNGVLLHHERIDGSGYPLKLQKDKIPLNAQVIAIVDTFDAMVSDRIYQAHCPPFEVFQLFEKEFHLYDITLTRIFMKNISQFYIGEEVELSNGVRGEIVFINDNHVSQPVVKVGTEFIDLYKVDLEINDVFIKK